MTKNETLLIMAKLSAFYGQGKADARMMAQAWHEILKDYDFWVANNAVTQFAKHDLREYATFPTVGVIVKEIEKEKGMINRIYNLAFVNGSYGDLPIRAQEIITEEQYKLIAQKGQEELQKNKQSVLAVIDSIYHASAPKSTQANARLTQDIGGKK